jgi:hypothetical protein
MAYFKSAVVLKTGEVISLPYSDSHEDIIRWIGTLKDSGGKRNWCRVEYVPREGFHFWDIDNYFLRLDERDTYIEEWFEPLKEKIEGKMKDLAVKQPRLCTASIIWHQELPSNVWYIV